MSKKETQTTCKNMFGDTPYQVRARQALPILVRQAWSQKPIIYQSLAEELGMANARNLNFVLGSIGVTLLELGKEWKQEIPAIQSLVINKNTQQPGSGFFGGKESYQKLTKRQVEARMQSEYAKIYSYPGWMKVLKSLGLAPPESGIGKLIEGARKYQGGGEGVKHKQLKEAISKNPTLVGLPASSKCMGTEYALPSGDYLDVFFSRGSHRYAVEVKSSISSDDDIARGLFQCVKYHAVLEAWMSYESQEVDVSVILALETQLPQGLLPLKNALQLEVVESVLSH